MGLNDYIKTYNFQTQPDNIFYIDINDFYNYKEISISCEWKGLKGLDSVVWVVTKDNINGSYWEDIPHLNRTLNAINGKCKFICADFNFKRLGLKIIKNSCYAGVLTIYLNAISNV